MNPGENRMLVTMTMGELRMVIRDEVQTALKAEKSPIGKWLTVGSAAEYFGTTRQTIHNWIKQGAPARQIGASGRPIYRIELPEFEAWVRAGNKG